MTAEIDALRMIETQLCATSIFLRTLDPRDFSFLPNAIEHLQKVKDQISKHICVAWEAENKTGAMLPAVVTTEGIPGVVNES